MNTRNNGQLFKTNHLALKEYLGQAMSHQVIEDWVRLGIGNAILLHPKLTHTKPYARLLTHDDGKPVQFVYELRWNKNSAHLPHISATLSHNFCVV